MTRQEDYLGCRVSERGYPNRYRTIDGVGVSRSQDRSEHPSSNNRTTTNQIENILENVKYVKFGADVLRLFDEARSILLTKHNDYGPTNISNAPGGPLNGLRVRIRDKTARINNLIDSGKDPQHESLRDSFLDLMNYAAIALLVIDNNWPGIEPNDTEADCG